jgi:glycogen debranching enzyme
MDAKVGDWVVTPRSGKAVEVNALWYNALRTMADFARTSWMSPQTMYEASGRQGAGQFGRFWNDALGYCYDVVDGPDGDDASLRPNQLLAVSLHHSPLGQAQQRAVVDVCARHLLTSHGLRSLAPGDPAYVGHYGGDQRQRDGPITRAPSGPGSLGPLSAPTCGSMAIAPWHAPFWNRCSIIFQARVWAASARSLTGTHPLRPAAAIAQAWSVAEVLRAWRATD